MEDVLKEAEADGIAGEDDVGDETGEVFDEDVPMEAQTEDDVEQDGTATGSTRVCVGFLTRWGSRGLS